MDELDSRILNALQNDFPIAQNPYKIIAQSLQIAPDELFDRVQNLFSEGIIRRIVASINSHKFDFKSTLATISVTPDKLEKASQAVAKFHEVTHSYQRNDKFNIWFTIIAPTEERITQILEQIRSELSLTPNQVLNLPMKRLFKLNARFKVS